MTISDVNFFNSLTASIDSSLSALQTSQEQLSTGKSVVVPSDNPAAFGEASVLSAEQSAVANDASLSDQLQSRLNTADGALAAAGNAITAAIQTATQAADGTTSATQLQSLAVAAQGQLSELLQNANLQYQGEFLFGGQQTLTAPFSAAGVYNGNTSVNSATFSNGTSVAVTFNGEAIFGGGRVGAIGALTQLVAALNAGSNAAAAAALPGLQAALAQIATARGGLGTSVNTLSTIAANANASNTALTGTISNLTGANVAQVSVQLSEEQLQEQALVSLAADTKNFLPVNLLA